MKYIPKILNQSIDDGDFEGLVTEITDWLWKAANQFPEQGGLPNIGELSILPEETLCLSQETLRHMIRIALDNLL